MSSELHSYSIKPALRFPSALVASAFLALVFTLYTGCAKAPTAPGQPTARGIPESSYGGQDGGGGNFLFNSVDEVEAAINESWTVYSNPLVTNNPFRLIGDNIARLKDPSAEDVYIYSMIVKVLAYEETTKFNLVSPKDVGPDVLKGKLHYISKAVDKIANDQPCDGPEHKKSTAAVTKLDRSGKVCFSSYAIARTPGSPDTLKIDLLALMAHEIAHLNGFDETDANRIQRYILTNSIAATDAKYFERRADYYKRLRNTLARWPRLLKDRTFGKNYAEELLDYQKNVDALANDSTFDVDSVAFRVSKTQKRKKDLYNKNIMSASIELSGLGFMIRDCLKGDRACPSASESLASVRKVALSAAAAHEALRDYFFAEENISGLTPIKNPSKQDQLTTEFVLQATDPQLLDHPIPGTEALINCRYNEVPTCDLTEGVGIPQPDFQPAPYKTTRVKIPY